LQILTEEDTPNLQMTSLATMELKFIRCVKYDGHKPVPASKFAGVSERSTTRVNEQSKKASLLSGITS
jgi:hypothetical protein